MRKNDLKRVNFNNLAKKMSELWKPIFCLFIFLFWIVYSTETNAGKQEVQYFQHILMFCHFINTKLIPDISFQNWEQIYINLDGHSILHNDMNIFLNAHTVL